MDQQIPADPVHRLQLPMLLLAIAFFLSTAFQTVLLVRERELLVGQHAAQEQPIQESIKVRQTLESLAGKTARLADQGNANAKTIVDDLKRQGITIKPTP